MASRRGRRRRGGAPKQVVAATSVPTGRAAYSDTRTWLLDTHGPVCAYCGLTFPAKTLTLDHVTPRRGQSAYDRRDNLVLACKRCNAAKADKSFLAWVLGARSRAVHLFAYGQHLSEGILDLLRPMVGDEAVRAVAKPVRRKRKARELFGPVEDDGESPYLDEARAPARRRGAGSRAPKGAPGNAPKGAPGNAPKGAPSNAPKGASAAGVAAGDGVAKTRRSRRRRRRKS